MNSILSKQKIVSFQEEILSWYKKHKRNLPWRQNRDPYRILVSEVMLQQTQVSRVIPKYEAWFEVFPTVASLANASVKDILVLWSGLGYNRRALFLQKTAQAIMVMHNGKWPTEVVELQKLSGIGDYTAHAVACFAFDKQVAVVDTNVRKVILLRFFPMEEHKVVNDRTIREIAKRLVPQGIAYDWNQALMDYAATVLKKEKIPVQKQSKFHGSNRYYRGKLLRLLLERGVIPTSELGLLLRADANAEWVEKLLGDMEKDGFIMRIQNNIRLKDS